MTFLEYQREAIKTRVGSADNEEYLTLGLIAEVGEVADKLAKRRRDGVFDDKAFVKELGDVLWFVANYANYLDREYGYSISYYLRNSFGEVSEYTDSLNCTRALAYWASSVVCDKCEFDYRLREVIHNLADLAYTFGYTLSQVAEINIAKLRDRQARGVIQGNGDER